jgi:8-oxo-dGTP pyrophosphatase MutT (NUDIX family)
MKIFEMENTDVKKAGFIPYFKKDENDFYMLFVKSSNPIYGGKDWMLVKGHIDEGETDFQAAMREAKEECGLKESNLIANTIQLGWKGILTNSRRSCPFSVYIGQVKDYEDFNSTDFEISEVRWMDNEEFQRFGTQRQKNIVSLCWEKIVNS